MFEIQEISFSLPLENAFANGNFSFLEINYAKCAFVYTHKENVIKADQHFAFLTLVWLLILRIFILITVLISNC